VLTSLKEKLIKIGASLFNLVRCVPDGRSRRAEDAYRRMRLIAG
jgi:hypothetical protein